MNRAPLNRTAARAGLSLVEVILALAILGMGLTALIATAARCLGVVRQAKNFETARHCLGRVDYEHPLQIEEEIKPGEESGSFEGGPEGFTWTRVIKQIGEEEDNLFEVATRVAWSDNGRHSKEEVVTYLYAPQNTKGGTVEGQP